MLAAAGVFAGAAVSTTFAVIFGFAGFSAADAFGFAATAASWVGAVGVGAGVVWAAVVVAFCALVRGIGGRAWGLLPPPSAVAEAAPMPTTSTPRPSASTRRRRLIVEARAPGSTWTSGSTTGTGSIEIGNLRLLIAGRLRHLRQPVTLRFKLKLRFGLAQAVLAEHG